MEIKKYSYDLLSHLSFKDQLYIKEPHKLKNFFAWDANIESFKGIIEAKKHQAIDRTTLVEVLKEQYQAFANTSEQLKLIDLLKEENTFTVTTAHQPSLLTGPLYYIFKIASAINLSRNLKSQYPQYHFVPLFITGGEDHDFEEINHLRLFNTEISWESKNWKGGSVGQLSTDGLTEVIDQAKEKLGKNTKGSEWLESEIAPLVSKSKNYSEFARAITHKIFGEHGIVILSMDDARLKKQFTPIIKKEIFNHASEAIIQKTQESLQELGWKPQAHARNINFFYRSQDARIRIVFEDGKFSTVDRSKNWTKEALENEIDINPNAFSPNVVMRPLFQESILPNLAYIGGGGEIAYWLERKAQFEHFDVPFPMLIRRSSGMFVNHSVNKQIGKTSMAFEDYFQAPDDLVKLYMKSMNESAYSLNDQKEGLKTLMEDAIYKAKAADPTLEKVALAELSKMEKGIETIEKKISKAIKRKEEVELNRMSKIQQKLFPDNGLQERKENFLEVINDYGFEILHEMIKTLDPLDKRFTVFFMPSPHQKEQKI